MGIYDTYQSLSIIVISDKRVVNLLSWTKTLGITTATDVFRLK